MIKTKNFREQPLFENGSFETEGFMEMLQSKDDSIVDTIEMTCCECPEQYNVFDKIGNQIAYIRVRYGELSVSCPSCLCDEILTLEIDGFGGFANNEERISMFSLIIDEIDKYYKNLQNK